MKATLTRSVLLALHKYFYKVPAQNQRHFVQLPLYRTKSTSIEEQIFVTSRIFLLFAGAARSRLNLIAKEPKVATPVSSRLKAVDGFRRAVNFWRRIPLIRMWRVSAESTR